MTTSGTWSFNLDITDILEEAYERVGSELRSGYDYRTGRRSLDLLMLEWQNKGLNLWTVKSDTQDLTAGTSAYTLAAERLDVIEALLRTDPGVTASQSDISLRRVSVSTYAKQTNKLLQGKPSQYWLERTPTGIIVNLWPVPDSSTYDLFYYYMEQIEDSGAPGSNTIDVPTRHLPCLVAGLAYYIALKTPSASDKVPMLKGVYDEQWTLAADSTREKASWRLHPGGWY